MTRRLPAGRDLLLAAVLVVLLGALVTGSVLVVLVLVALAGTALPFAAQRLGGLLAGAAPSQAVLVRAQAHLLCLLAHALVLVFVLRAHPVSPVRDGWLVLAVAVVELLRLVHASLLEVDDRLRRPRAELRGLPGPGGPLPRRPPVLGQRGWLAVAALGVPLPLALVWALASGSYGLVLPAALLSVLLALAVVLVDAADVHRLLRRPRGAALVRGVHDVVRAHAPLVVLYSNGGPEDLHWVTGWLPTLEAVGRPALVMLRKPGTIDLVPPSSVPVVCLPEAGDVLPFSLPSAKVALFAANGGENLRLLRDISLRSAFIAHGDSDKAASSNPVVRMYDEVWVAGEAGRRRYLDADVGVRPEQLRIVGRPQTQRVEPRGARPAGDPYCVLYAPTWEGLSGDPAESSLVHSGPDVVRALLAAGGTRVVFRPHPKTGQRSAAHAAASREVAALLAAAGGPHETVLDGDRDLISCFNDADALVTDVSAVISDFLASDKPYVVVNGGQLADEQFRAANPSSAGAYLVHTGAADLPAAIADARGPDTLQERRREVRRMLIGPPDDDPVGTFASAIDALAARARPAGPVSPAGPAIRAQPVPRSVSRRPPRR